MIKSLVYSLITKGTVALINFLILIISSRYLGVSSRGEISVFILNISIIQVINEVYTGYSIIHFIPRFNFRKLIMNGLFYTLVFCSLSNLLICFFNKQVPGYEWLGYFISLLVILNTFNCVLILGRENIRLYNFLSFIQPFCLLAGILICIFIFRRYTFLAYAYPLLFSFAIAIVFSSGVIAGLLAKEPRRPEFRLKPILVHGFMFQATLLIQIFVSRYSYYLLPGFANVGLYASALSLMEALLIVVNSISPVLMARVANKGNTPVSTGLTLALSKASFLFSLLIVAVLFLVPGSLFVTILGPGFAGIKDLMLLYAPGVLMISIFGPVTYYFSATGRQRQVLLCYSLGFASTLILSPLLIRGYGNAGAAYSATIAYFLVACAVCTTFIRTNKLGLRRFFSLRLDYRYLKELVNSENREPGA